MALGQFSPGPDMLLLTRASLAEGLAAGWWMSLGIATGLCVHATFAVFGMAYLMDQEGWITNGFRWVAAAYLGYLGIRLLPAALSRLPRGQSTEKEERARGQSAFMRGFLCNLLNPKVVLIFAAVVAEFVTGEYPFWWSLVLWIIIVGQGLILWMIYVWLLQFPPFRRGYQRAGPWFDSAFGLGLLSLVVFLLIN